MKNLLFDLMVIRIPSLVKIFILWIFSAAIGMTSIIINKGFTFFEKLQQVANLLVILLITYITCMAVAWCFKPLHRKEVIQHLSQLREYRSHIHAVIESVKNSDDIAHMDILPWNNMISIAQSKDITLQKKWIENKIIAINCPISSADMIMHAVVEFTKHDSAIEKEVLDILHKEQINVNDIERIKEIRTTIVKNFLEGVRMYDDEVLEKIRYIEKIYQDI